MLHKLKYLFFLLLALTMLQSCTTYYEKSKKTESALLMQDYSKAKKSVLGNNFLKKKRNKLLFNLEMGKICHLNKEFDTSNYYFNIASELMEEQNLVGDFAVSTLANPSLQTYRANEYERIIIHYYKALNYLQLGLIEDAVVEARQLNLKEQELFVAHKSKNKNYSKDPFGLTLMGMIYEADHDFNNAFIAYRNAYEYYKTSNIYKDNIPNSLLNDVVRNAKLAGIYYKSDHKSNYETKGKGGELILFWENGLAPIKKEESIFFTLNKGKQKGLYIFTSTSGNIKIPVNYNFDESNDFNINDIGLLKIAHSFYVSRNKNTTNATAELNGDKYKFSVGEDIEKLSFQIQKENYLKELAKRLIRMVVKKIAEIKLAKQNEVAGLALSVANVAMEKSDTRNWQSLPSKIYYTRIPLIKGKNKLKITLGNGKYLTMTIIGNGKMVFKNIVTIK